MVIKMLMAPFATVYRWLDARLDLTVIIEKNLTKKMVPTALCFWGCFGGLSFVVVLLQFISGVFLLFFYRPTPGEAFTSVQYLRHQVPLGWLMEKAHVIGPHVMIALILIHMGRIFYKGIFHSPRELHWISGVVLFGVVFGFAYTGAELPDHLRRWQGDASRPAVAAASEGSTGLARIWHENRFTIMYIVHVCILPLIMVVFLGVHFVMIRKTGIHEPL